MGMRNTIGVDWGTDTEPSYKSERYWELANVTRPGRREVGCVTLPLMGYLKKKRGAKMKSRTGLGVLNSIQIRIKQAFRVGLGRRRGLMEVRSAAGG